MEGSNRSLLKKGQIILLSLQPDGSLPQEYQIQRMVGEGSSAVCYDAIRLRDGQPGKLKEFYPIDSAGQDWYYSLERLPDGQLVPRGGTVRRFTEMCREYLGTYALLNRVMVENPKNQVLKNYIQNIEPLYGTAPCPTGADGRFGSTVYCWSPGILGQGFDAYLAQVRRTPTENAPQALYNIINTIYTLADCIRALHTAGLMHLDIKPENFLLPYNSREGVNSDSVSLFDISTLYSVRNPIPQRVGTEGYRAPEVLRGRADNRSDLYSMGAMLFYALVVDGDIPDGLYRDGFYSRLDRLVSSSPLLAAAGADARLTARLAGILKKCLAPRPNDRYDGCTTLMEALEKPRFEARKNAVSPHLIGQNRKLAIVEVNEQGSSAPDIVTQKLLYQRPLYEALEPGARQLRVLVIGSGAYGQNFIDHCLQAGQMKDISIRVTAVSTTPQEDMDSYLRTRPALPRFVNVNGSLELAGPALVDPRAYGHLRFVSLNEACGIGGEPLSFELTDRGDAHNARLAAELVERSGGFDYMFIALGNTRVNQRLARVLEANSSRCPVCYISGQKKKRGRPSRLWPVCIREPITPESIDPHLEQMAFNTHIAYEESLNLDIMAARAKFLQDTYAYNSSLAYALSIPYKLFSIGIVMENEAAACGRFPGATLVRDVSQAARAFHEQVLSRRQTDPEARAKFDTLVYLEHRRWVLDRVTEGWDIPKDKDGQLDLEQCARSGRIKNPDELTHPCLVFSTEATPLSSPAYTENGRARWEDPRIDPRLDELDRMSLELHQRFRAHARAFKAADPLGSEDLQVIQALLLGAPEPVIRAWQQYLFCLKNILNGMDSYTRQHAHYAQCFTEELYRLPPELADKIRARLALVAQGFRPVIEANLYRNYKAYDEALVEKIPFILTYRFQASLAMAFSDGRAQNGRNEAVFSNVASATVLSPASIHYLYNFDDDSRIGLLADKLSAVLNYLSRRKVHCSVHLAVAFPAHIGSHLRAALQQRLEMLKNKDPQGCNALFLDYVILDCADSREATGQYLTYLSAHGVTMYDGSAGLFDSGLDQTDFLAALMATGLPYFEFDWQKKVFNQHRGCEYLRYIHDRSGIRIQDMFALMNAEDTRFHLPEFAGDYQTLWGIYTGCDTPGERFEDCVGAWNHLCILLEKQEKLQKPLAYFNPVKYPEQTKEFFWLLPEFTFRTVQTVLARLTEYQILAPDSRVENYTTDSCKVTVTAPAEYERALEALFARPELLLGHYALEVVRRAGLNGESIQVRYQNMNVTDLILDDDGRGQAEARTLRRLQSHRFIRNLVWDGDRVSFTYASGRIKQLLTSAGQILEVYTYYQLLATGFFDDVACGYEFRWQDGGVKNELDIVATKGFRSIIVECKAVQQLELGYYHKLHSVADHFGIGTTKVLIGNTYRKDDALTSASNRMQRSRGEQLNIITVSEPERIHNIGQTLKEILEN